MTRSPDSFSIRHLSREEFHDLYALRITNSGLLEFRFFNLLLKSVINKLSSKDLLTEKCIDCHQLFVRIRLVQAKPLGGGDQ